MFFLIFSFEYFFAKEKFEILLKWLIWSETEQLLAFGPGFGGNALYFLSFYTHSLLSTSCLFRRIPQTTPTTIIRSNTKPATAQPATMEMLSLSSVAKALFAVVKISLIFSKLTGSKLILKKFKEFSIHIYTASTKCVFSKMKFSVPYSRLSN